MRTMDLTPFYRNSVGFDRLFRALESMDKASSSDPVYPPYDIEMTGEDAYRITLAIAGFAPEELSVETMDNQLVVAGEHKAHEASDDVEAGTSKMLHRGIANRSFRRSFQLADHVRVTAANLDNGLLHIDLVREMPEAMKPRRIDIGSAAPKSFASKAKKLVESVA